MIISPDECSAESSRAVIKYDNLASNNHLELNEDEERKNDQKTTKASSISANRDNTDDDDDDANDSADEALMAMLGLSSLSVHGSDESEHEEVEICTSNNPHDAVEKLEERDIESILASQNLREEYWKTGVCLFPPEIRVPSALMRRLTDELVWGGDKVRCDKTYETITVVKAGEVFERRTLTRLENFVQYHDGWSRLCRGYLKQCISALLGQEMVLFKEKLNLKPPGGSGFAPHLDGPSLRIALGDDGPKTFVTVMVAIDNMTSSNGCLRLCKGPWSEGNTCEVVQPEEDGNPDAGGRAGAIPPDVADSLDFDDLCCEGGAIAAFGEWTPHRSAANSSHFPRRAVFLTYNPASEGDCHSKYYDTMEAKRNEWRTRIGLAAPSQVDHDHQAELNALATIPKI